MSASVSVGATRRVSSNHENFGGRLCIRWRQFDRGQLGGGSGCCDLHVESRVQYQPGHNLPAPTLSTRSEP